MNGYKTPGIIKDVLLVILLTIPLTFIDIQTALLVGAVSITLLLIWRNTHRLNTRHLNGYVISSVGNELTTPKGVELFELSNDAPMEALYNYIEILKAIYIYPKVLIIRFKQIRQISLIEADILDEVIRRLSKNGIKTFLSDVEANLSNQLKKYNLEQKNGEDIIFFKIEDALSYAKEYITSNNL